MMNPLASDLDYVLAHTEGLWQELRGNRLFITGGTGFFGCWLMESFNWANHRLQLGASATLLTRNPEAFQRRLPQLATASSIQLHCGDIRSFDFPDGEFSHIIHAATESSTGLNELDPLLMLDTIIHGTRRVLDFAIHCRAGKMLLTSSGAVYGRQPSQMTHIPETYLGAPETASASSAYGEGKRVAELLCAAYHKSHSIETKIARCFAFVGPYLPMDAHFAIGNFIQDALEGRPIQVKGDGTPYRSYLYAADLAIWLWTILLKGKPCHPYNVGSEEDLTIEQLAALVADSLVSTRGVSICRRADAGALPERYVPATARARSELGLINGTPLSKAIRSTASWHRNRSKIDND
jgi:nucleoside-diphosphate-sugar epimerase